MKGKDYGILQDLKIPSVLVEIGYLSNEDDLDKIKKFTSPEITQVISASPALV